MLWFFKSFFPVVWIAFLLYWRIQPGDPKQPSAANRPARASCDSSPS